MNRTIDYNFIKETLNRDFLKGTELFVEYINLNTNDEKYQSEAISLKSEFDLYDGQVEVQQIIVEEMLQMAEEVEKEVTKHTEVELVEQELKNVENFWLEKRAPKEIIFECKNIYKKYKRTNFTLKDISLKLKTGEITGIVGENGNGKTTLLKIIAGELTPDRGKLAYPAIEQQQRYTLQWQYIKRQVAYLPQELGRYHGSVLRSVQYAAAIHGIRGKQNIHETDSIINRLGLGNYRTATWDDLSGGYKLRFALATILVWKPKMIVLDEPLANLDINTQIKVLNDLWDLSKSIKNPITVVMSSQNIEEVEAASDNMIVLREGMIRLNCDTESIGEHRQENQFEFKCFETTETLKEKLKFIGQYSSYNNGFTYYITLPRHFSPQQFLAYCVQNDIEINYFQDISTSTKRIIVQTNPVT